MSDCSGGKVALGALMGTGNRVRMTIFVSKIGFIHCIGNSFGEETTEVLCQRMSGDLFNEIMFLSDVI